MVTRHGIIKNHFVRFENLILSRVDEPFASYASASKIGIPYPEPKIEIDGIIKVVLCHVYSIKHGCVSINISCHDS